MDHAVFYELNETLKTDSYNINDFIEKYSVEEIILALKRNGIGVNSYPDSNSYNQYLKVRPQIYSKILEQEKDYLIKEYDQEINTMNALFEDFYSKEQFNEVSQVADDKKIFAFLIAFEFYIRALHDRKINGGKNKDNYGDVDIQRNINGKNTGIDALTANQFSNIIECIYLEACKIVQSFIFHGFLYNNKKFECCSPDEEIDWIDIIKSFNHFSLIDIRTVLFDIYEDWKFGNYKVLQHDNKNIEIKPEDIKSKIDEKIELRRFETSRLSFLKELSNMNARNVNDGFLPNSLAPKSYLDDMEEISYKDYIEYFSSQNLNYEIKGIEIVKWLRAYAVVRYYNREFLSENTFPGDKRPDKWLYISTLSEWIEKFTMFGIDKSSAQFICNKFILKKNSRDWFDSPFIQIGGKIITVPSCASIIQDALALMSLATKENLNLEFKGYCFENRILNDLNANQIPAVSVKRKVEHDEFQCDLAFVLGKDLFLCECKHTAQPITQRKRYDFYNQKIPDEIQQTNRICDFYSSNIHHVIDELNKKKVYTYSPEWRPRNVYRVLIYSCKLAGKLNIDGVIVTDYTVFTTLLYKNLPTIYEGGKPIMQFIPPKMRGAFQGKLTTNKLLNFIDQPYQVEYQKAFVKVEDEIILINKIYLNKKKVSITTDIFGSKQ